jgi:hypothetical protein
MALGVGFEPKVCHGHLEIILCSFLLSRTEKELARAD